MSILQKTIQIARRFLPRGWSPLLRSIVRIYPEGTLYPAELKNSDRIYLDLRENMCHTYFYYGELPHERFTEAFMKNYLRSGDVCLDIGANIGYFTRIMSSVVGPGGRVHAFEPMPSAIRCLRKNVENLQNVTLHEIALSDRVGKSAFSIRNLGDTSSLGSDSSSKNVIEVQTNTVDCIAINEAKIDFIKIDVEGYEYEVLMGAVETLTLKRPLLYFEYIDSFARLRGRSIEDFRSLLAPLGYSFGWINADFPRSSLVSKTPSSYLIAVPSGNRWNIVISE